MVDKQQKSFFDDKVLREKWEEFQWADYTFRALIKIDGILTKRRTLSAKRTDPRFKQIFSKEMIVSVMERNAAVDRANADIELALAKTDNEMERAGIRSKGAETLAAVEKKFAERIADKMGPEVLLGSASLTTDPEITIDDIVSHVIEFHTPDGKEDIKYLLENELLPDQLVDDIKLKVQELNNKGRTVMTPGGRKNLSVCSDGGTESSKENLPSGQGQVIS